jgi:hypothetical protein
MIDMEFIKFMLPHSVLLVEALLAEATSTARKRCRAVSELGEEQEEMNVARGAIRVCVAVNTDGGLVKRFVIEDDTDKK